jgi:DNA-directed RNA polymerase specialized sigma54-like protein
MYRESMEGLKMYRERQLVMRAFNTLQNCAELLYIHKSTISSVKDKKYMKQANGYGHMII